MVFTREEWIQTTVVHFSYVYVGGLACESRKTSPTRHHAKWTKGTPSLFSAKRTGTTDLHRIEGTGSPVHTN